MNKRYADTTLFLSEALATINPIKNVEQLRH
jgi:hypothetical protein